MVEKKMSCLFLPFIFFSPIFFSLFGEFGTGHKIALVVLHKSARTPSTLALRPRFRRGFDTRLEPVRRAMNRVTRTPRSVAGFDRFWTFIELADCPDFCVSKNGTVPFPAQLFRCDEWLRPCRRSNALHQLDGQCTVEEWYGRASSPCFRTADGGDEDR